MIGSQTTTLHQIFCEILLHSKVIFKSMRVAEDTFYWKCEWDNLALPCRLIEFSGYHQALLR